MPASGLNKQHRVLGSKQRWSFAWRCWGSIYLLSPGPPPLPEQLSSALLLPSLLCGGGSMRGGGSALSTQECPSLGSRARAGSAAHGCGLLRHVEDQRAQESPPSGVFGALGLLQEGQQEVVPCKPVAKPGHCLCFEWEKNWQGQKFGKS